MRHYLDTLSQTPRLVRELVDSAPDVDRKNGDFFSIRENVAHLRDIDTLGYEPRIRLMVSEEHPTLADVDGARIAIERAYATLPIEPELAELERSRAASIALLRTLDESALDRTAELETVGRVTLRELLERWITHDSEHLAEMRGLA
jgi:DinB superfamily